ncbi:hypothetical protein, partial [Fontibacillus panacisegetis]|uniref:hypothetical protein n=1 Tax=Fontibacillus solani TaxID=1572857 RepID=UPI001C72632F
YNITGFADVFPFLSPFLAHLNSSTANFGFEPFLLQLFVLYNQENLSFQSSFISLISTILSSL